MLLDNVQLWAVRWKVEQAQRFAALFAKPFYGFATMPWRIVDENNKPWKFYEEFPYETDESFLCLSCNKPKNKIALGSCPYNMKPVTCVIDSH